LLSSCPGGEITTVRKNSKMCRTTGENEKQKKSIEHVHLHHCWVLYTFSGADVTEDVPSWSIDHFLPPPARYHIYMACTILSYIIRVLREKKKTRPLSNNNPPSLSPYIYIYPDRFYFIFWVVGSVSCRCCSARHFLYNAFNFCANDPCALEGCALTHTNQQHPTWKTLSKWINTSAFFGIYYSGGVE
jgi:hypothetical protein